MDKRQSGKVNRRGFLATAGSGLAAASMVQQTAGQEPDDQRRQVELDNPQVGQPVSQTAKARGGGQKVPGEPPKKLGYCIVGLGMFGVGEILPAFADCQHATPVALVSGDRDKAEAIAANYGISRKKIYNYENYDSIADDDEIDIVYIILPNALHAEYTVRALEAGKHVLCEKPMATTVEDCQRMMAAAKKADRKLMIAYRAQYETYNLQAIQWIREEKYGPIQFITSDTVIDVGGPNQWRLDKKLAGGGSLMDIGIYSLNATRYLTGEEPLEVSAMQIQDKSDPRFSEVEQTILFQLRFPGGTLAKCSSSYSTHPVNQYTVACRDGWLKLAPATSYRGLRFFHGTGDREEQLRLRENNQFAAEMDHLAEAIKNDQPVKTPGEEGLQDVKLMHLIYKAAQSGETLTVG